MTEKELYTLFKDIKDAYAMLFELEVVDDWEMVNENKRALIGFKLEDAENKICGAMKHL